jgi:hypothetical protein
MRTLDEIRAGGQPPPEQLFSLTWNPSEKETSTIGASLERNEGLLWVTFGDTGPVGVRQVNLNKRTLTPASREALL